MKLLRNWIDTFLDKLTMYHIVVQGLVVLCLAGLVLMITGYLDYSPLSFIISTILLITVSYASNKLLGWLFGVKPHGESAVITGLILSLLFSPPTTVLMGVKLAIVAIIAMASKYILAIRGKHVFNPAAMAIVIASVTGVAYASWWIATPALLVITIVVSGVILYKTQTTRMALLFLAVAIPLVVIQTGITGTLTLMSVGAAITSWPFIFFAGIMLSEPQTLPPRRYQRYAVAIVVAILIVIPFHYGSLLMTPALALVLGNILAFYYGTRRGITLRLISIQRIGGDGYELTFDAKPFMFVPGQYIELSLPHHHMDVRGMRRVFTIIGRPGGEQISIATRVPQKASSFKRALIGMKNGQIIYGTRIAGDFVMPIDTAAPLVFIAGGIGITPLMSFLVNGDGRNITLIYLVKSVADVMFIAQLKRYDLKIIVVTKDTDPLPDADWIKEKGSLTMDVLQSYIDLSSMPRVYISGPPQMVKNARQLTKALGVKSIYTDHFTGY